MDEKFPVIHRALHWLIGITMAFPICWLDLKTVVFITRRIQEPNRMYLISKRFQLLSVVLLLFLQFLSYGAKTPNVLFIATDDLRVELGCYGQDWIHSPNLDKFATQSTQFDRAYCQAALCNPSRSSVMTGLYPDIIGVIDLPTHFRQVAPEVVTLPEHFKNNGYFTQNIGKVYHNWHHGDRDGDPQSWSVPAVLHYNTHSKDVPTPASLIKGQTGNHLHKYLRKRADNFDVPDEAYFDGRIAEKAVTALSSFKENDQPFFLAVGFWKPHLPFNAPAKYWDYYLKNESLKPLLAPNHRTRPDGMPELAGHSGRDELFHLSEDPGESINLIHDQRPIVRAAYARLNKQLLERKQMIEENVF